MGLVLSPELKMRSDGGRAILFSANPADSVNNPAFCFLYPQQALVLCLFDGKRDKLTILKEVAYLFGLDIEGASRFVEALLAIPVNPEQTVGSFIVDISRVDPNKVRFYDPVDFIVPAEKVDMDNVRCNTPYSITILPTMRCVASCCYCYADRESFRYRREFDLLLFKRLLKEIEAFGIESIQFSGGDLFCRRDAFDIIECTLSAGIYPNIPTKFPLTQNQARRLARIGLSTIQVSIDALNPEIIDALVSLSGYGKKIVKTIDDLGEEGIRVRTNTVLTPYNIKDAVNLAEYLAQKPHVFKCSFGCYYRSLYYHRDDLFCSPSDIHEFEIAFNKIRNMFPQKAMFFSGAPFDPHLKNEAERVSIFMKRAACTIAKRGVIVLPDARVTVCEELYGNEDFVIGDLTTQTLTEIWNSPKALRFVRPNQKEIPDGPCKDCSDFHQCTEGLGRCIRDVLKAYGKDRSHWPDPRCPRAPEGNRLG